MHIWNEIYISGADQSVIEGIQDAIVELESKSKKSQDLIHDMLESDKENVPF